MKIIVSEYDPSWEQNFQTIAKALAEVLTNIRATIEHVGSTSVPGLAAKPILDIDVIVSRENTQQAIKALENLGYQHRGDLGIEDRETFYPAPQFKISHHLYLCVKGSLPLRNHLTLRDWLRAHPEDRDRYGALKKQLAEQYPNDIDSYIAGKTEFIISILGKADFSQNDIASIQNVNKASPN